MGAQGNQRPAWADLPERVRHRIERIAGGTVVKADNRPGGFSPGLASRLRLADGTRVFAKAVSVDWPVEAALYRSETNVARRLPGAVPAPRLRGAFDDHGWVGLVFDDVAGRMPGQPWNPAELERVLQALTTMSGAAAPRSVAVGRDHPRLGGWDRVAADEALLADLPTVSPWAADHLTLLVELERQGVAAAGGDALVHFDLYPHNILLGSRRVYFVDWAHARLGNPLVDLVSVLCSVATTGADPSRVAEAHPLAGAVEGHVLDALIAAHAGFCAAGALLPARRGRQAIRDAKRELAEGSLSWLAHRRQESDPEGNGRLAR